MPKRLVLIIAGLLSLSVSGCAANTVATDSVPCVVLEILDFSQRDTEETIDQIVEQNEVIDQACD